MAKTPEYQIKASNRYNKKSTKMIQIRLNLKTDADILEHLATLDNVAGYVKKLIRADMGQGSDN